MTEIRSVGILGTGSSLPSRVVTNFDLEQKLETTDEWIRVRTGIRERRIAGPGEATADFAIEAGRRAMESAGVGPESIDLVIVATCTPDLPFPATAVLVQNALGIPAAAAFDLNAVCSGFTYGLDVAAQMVRAGAYERALLIGADVMSRTVDWTDRGTSVLFGDAAAAVVIGPVSDGGIKASVLRADGSGVKLLYVPAGGSREPVTAEGLEARRNCMVMNGREVYRFAVHIMGEVALEALKKCGMTASDVSLFIPHQANIRIIESAAKRLNLPSEKVFVNVERYGNTSAASIPLALDEAVRTGRIKPGDIVVTVGFGSGLTWAANVIQWSGSGER